MSESPPKAPLRLKERLETLCSEMIDRGILFVEAAEQFEKCFITEIVRRNSGSLSDAARKLGIHRNTLTRKLASYRSGNRRRA